ncbi:hypothetical protein ACO0R3_002793, partial [Hanseniaspora guilliermondii]
MPTSLPKRSMPLRMLKGAMCPFNRTSKGITDLLLPQTSIDLKSIVPIRRFTSKCQQLYLRTWRRQYTTKLALQLFLVKHSLSFLELASAKHSFAYEVALVV